MSQSSNDCIISKCLIRLMQQFHIPSINGLITESSISQRELATALIYRAKLLFFSFFLHIQRNRFPASASLPHAYVHLFSLTHARKMISRLTVFPVLNPAQKARSHPSPPRPARHWLWSIPPPEHLLNRLSCLLPKPMPSSNRGRFQQPLPGLPVTGPIAAVRRQKGPHSFPL